MNFLQPVWIILLIPLFLLLYFRRPSSVAVLILRTSVFLLVTTALMQPRIKMLSDKGMVLILADRSLSMPEKSAEKESEIIRIIEKSRPSGLKTAVISFGENAAVDKSAKVPHFSGFSSIIDRTGTNLDNAVDLALSVIPEHTSAKILMLSDGCFTAGDPGGSGARLASAGISCDYRVIRRSSANDLSISSFQKPDSVDAGELFKVTAWFYTPMAGKVTYTLTRNGYRIIKRTETFDSGMNKISFFDKGIKPGTVRYKLSISNQYKDPVPENNSAEFLIGVRGPRSVLHITNTENSPFGTMLKRGGINIESVKPEDFDSSIIGLSSYSCLILENISANQIGSEGLENIVSWVEESGAGLMMTGGKNSYALGGYYNSPLEKILPVSMELKQEHRKFAVAIVVVLDRSGSMGMQVPGGQTKMDLANISTVQVFDLLSPFDEFGVIAVDSSPHKVLELKSKQEVSGYARPKISHIQSMGGGIFIYEALASAVGMVSEGKSANKHIILFADASDSEQPGEYKELLKKAYDAGITVSVIGLGKPSDCDAELLKNIAELGHGQCYFTENAHELPRLFAQDTFIVARNSFLTDPVKVSFTVDAQMLSPENFGTGFSVGGYNINYLKPGANIGAVTTDENKAPVTAFRYAGAGRVLCFTGEVNGKYTPPLDKWEHFGDYFTSLTSWISATPDSLGNNMVLSCQTIRSVYNIRIHLDPDRDSDPFTARPFVKVIVSGDGGQGPETVRKEFEWEDADTLKVKLNLRSGRTYLPTVFAEGRKETLPPVCLPFLQEFNIDPAGGEAALKSIASISGGKEISDFSEVWKDIPEKIQNYSLAEWLILFAVLLFFLEILERRTLLLSYVYGRYLRNRLLSGAGEGKRRVSAPVPAKEKRVRKGSSGEKSAEPGVGSNEVKKAKKNHPEGNSKDDDASNSLSEALKKAKNHLKK